MSITAGSPAPKFKLTDQHGETFDLVAHRGSPVLIYFYPKADTPGCTTQACGLRDVRGDIGDTVIVGISPDKPEKLAKFDAKYSLGFALASDPDHAVATAYGAWGPKKLYGREYEGVIRSAFLVGADGELAEVWPKISPKDTPLNLLKALGET